LHRKHGLATITGLSAIVDLSRREVHDQEEGSSVGYQAKTTIAFVILLGSRIARIRTIIKTAARQPYQI
jgi:hypothetical protein